MPEFALGLTGDHGLRDIADRLLETERVEYIRDGVLTFVPPAGFPHQAIVRELAKQFINAYALGRTAIDWAAESEHLHWEWRDGSGRFFIPDIAVTHPGARSRQESQDSVVLIAEVPSPDCDTVENDLDIKPKRYAKNGVPFYLLVDQRKGEWTLHSLIKDWPRYEVHSSGGYGVPIELPEPFGFSIETADWPPYEPDPADGYVRQWSAPHFTSPPRATILTGNKGKPPAPHPVRRGREHE